MTSKLRQASLRDVPAQQARIEIGPQRVDVVQEQVLQLRAIEEQPGQRAVAEHVGHLEPVAGGVQALQRHVVGVVVAAAGRFGPADERGVQALADLLGLHVEDLLRHFLPGKAQVAGHGHHPQADRTARRGQQQPGIRLALLAIAGNARSVRA